MSRRAIIAFVAIAATAAGLGLLLRRTTRARERARPAETIRQPRPLPPRSAVVAEPEPEPGAPPADTDATLSEAHHAMALAAKPCLAGRAPRQALAPGYPDETVQRIDVEYRLRIQDGRAGPVDLSVRSRTIEDEGLAQCMIDRLHAARWITRAGDQELRMRHAVSVGDLLRPDGELAPTAQRSPRPTAAPPPELWDPPRSQLLDAAH